MSEFAYRARDRRGGMVSGVLKGGSQDEILHTLRGQGMSVLSVSARGSTGPLARLQAIQVGPSKVTQKDIVYFTNQLSVMVDTGVPLPEALRAIVQQTTSPALRTVLSQVAEDVDNGESFSDSLGKHPKVFGTMVVSLIRAGEVSGNLGTMLTRVAEYLVEAQETRRQVVGAMIYPAFMMLMAITVVVVLMVVVLPRFTKIYGDKGAALPGPTRVLLAMSDFCMAYWIPLVVVTVAVVVGLVLTLRTEGGRRVADRVKLKMPVFGPVLRKFYMARAFRALGTMVNAGVPVLDALEIARATASNEAFAAVFDRAVERVREGETLADQFFCSDLIPVTMGQMIYAGESSGQLGSVMLKVSQFCDRDLKAGLKTMTNMLEPALIAFMGLFVGGVAVALLLPMFTINKVITQ